MPVKINYSTKSLKKLSSNVVFFVNEKFSTNNIKRYISNIEFSYINDLLKTSDLKKNIYIYEVSSKKKIALISLKNNIKTFDVENLGAEFYGRINYGKNSEYIINFDDSM